MPAMRSYGLTSSFLRLDGEDVGPLASARGGDAVAEVVRQPRPGGGVRKHLGNVGYSDLELETDLTTLVALSDWVSAAWAGDARTRNGAVLTADVNLRVRAEREFFDARIREVAFPALDAAAKEPGRFGIRLRPGYTRDAKSSGTPLPVAPTKAKKWMASAFRLEIDGLDCGGVVRIDPFAVRQTLLEERVGIVRDPAVHVVPIDFPDLRVTISERGAESWAEWHRRFVVEGRSSDADEKRGAVVLLGPDLRAELGRIELSGVGIFALAAGGTDARDGVRRFTADLYCERMELRLGEKGLAAKAMAVPAAT